MNANAFPLVGYEQSGRTATIVLAKPEKGNALCLSMVEGLIAAFARAQQAQLIVFRGEGRHFCTGLDLSTLGEETDATLLQRFVRIEELRNAIETSPVPTVALGTGAVYGAGADIFAACDHRIALSGTQFAFPGGAFGIVLGTSRLAELVGQQVARSILLGRRVLRTDEAHRIGLVTEIAETLEAILARQSELAVDAGKLGDATTAALRRMTRQDRTDADLAALVRSASQPGLKSRIEAYRASLGKP